MSDLIEFSPISATFIHLVECTKHKDDAELELNLFLNTYTSNMISADLNLASRLLVLETTKNKAWLAYFLAWRAAHPPTLEDILWCVAKAGFITEVAPLMNLSKATRNCKNLQPLMMNVGLGDNNSKQLHFYSYNGMLSSVVRLLLIKNIDANVKDVSGWSPLHYAVVSENNEMVQLLLGDVTVNADSRAIDGKSPLHIAAQLGSIATVHSLVNRGGDIEGVDVNGWRPLHFAAYSDQREMVQELCDKYHVDIYAIEDEFDSTALRIAVRMEHDDVAAFLRHAESMKI